MVTESKGTTVVAGLIHKGPTVSYRYTTLLDATATVGSALEVASAPLTVPIGPTMAAATMATGSGPIIIAADRCG